LRYWGYKMRITKRQLRRIIKEEKQKLLERGSMTAQGPESGYDYVMYPDEYTKAAEEMLTPEELQSVQQRYEVLAIDLADELAYKLADSLEGFGSSDRTYELQGYIEQLGFKTGFPKGTLEIIREGHMKITKRQLRRIIKEEKAKVLAEQETSADRAIGLYFDVNQQKMTFESLSVLFDESVVDAIEDGYEEIEARQVVLEAMEQLFEEWRSNKAY
jgi:hypothetical protein